MLDRPEFRPNPKPIPEAKPAAGGVPAEQLEALRMPLPGEDSEPTPGVRPPSEILEDKDGDQGSTPPRDIGYVPVRQVTQGMVVRPQEVSDTDPDMQPPEVSPEMREVEPPYLPPDLLVERRQVGNVEVVVVLGDQTPDNYAMLAGAVVDCDVVAFANPKLHSDPFRVAVEDFYTNVVSADPDPKMARAVSEAANDPETPFHPGGVLEHLKGTDKGVVLLDMDPLDPRYRLLAEASRSGYEAAAVVVDLKPLDSARGFGAYSNVTMAEATQAQDEVILEQLHTLVEQCETVGGLTKVGVILGMTHHRAIATLGDGVPPERAAQLAEEVDQHLGARERALFATMAEDHTQREALTEKTLLGAYVRLFCLSRAESGEIGRVNRTRVAEKMVDLLTDKQREQLLASLGEALADEARPYAEKFAKVRETLLPTLNALIDSGVVTPHDPF